MQKLTKAEEEIMQLIWQLGPCTVSQVIDLIEEEPKPPHSSISSIVRILEKKGFVDHKAYGRTYEYFPIVSKEEYSGSTVKSLINDYFEGSVKSLVSFLVKQEKVDKDELMKILNESDKKR
ncbi:MAG: BlaI/MecI/CopY family transcriptional regulator [Saprospiraceae bacterium]|jgi:BlaI family penicillinase repressor|nr:BlaI/MecI/CopY family transcriptional regulator [Saprospiraceae bacterium]